MLSWSRLRPKCYIVTFLGTITTAEQKWRLILRVLNHEEYPVRRGSLPLVDEDVDGLRVDEDLLMVGHGVRIHSGGRYFE